MGAASSSFLEMGVYRFYVLARAVLVQVIRYVINVLLTGPCHACQVLTLGMRIIIAPMRSRTLTYSRALISDLYTPCNELYVLQSWLHTYTMAEASGWTWGSAWGDNAAEDEEEEAEERVSMHVAVELESREAKKLPFC